MKTLEEILEEAYKINWDKGFHSITDTDDFVIEKSCNNIHDEVSELHEAWRNGDLRAYCDKSDKMEELNIEPLICLEEEIADVIIRAYDTGKRLGIDVVRAVRLKHEYNKTRPFKHGGKKS